MCLLWITSIVVEFNHYCKKMGHQVSLVKKWLDVGGVLIGNFLFFNLLPNWDQRQGILTSLSQFVCLFVRHYQIMFVLAWQEYFLPKMGLNRASSSFPFLWYDGSCSFSILCNGKTAHQKIFPSCDSRLLTKMISRLSKEESLLPHSNNRLFPILFLHCLGGGCFGLYFLLCLFNHLVSMVVSLNHIQVGFTCTIMLKKFACTYCLHFLITCFLGHGTATQWKRGLIMLHKERNLPLIWLVRCFRGITYAWILEGKKY